MRRLAVTALARSGRPALAQPIAELTLLPEFVERSFEEKQRCFAAVARLGGERGLDWFASMLRQPLPRWFVPRQARETVEAAAAALALVRTPAARRLLQELAASGERTVRAACREVLKGRKGPDAG